VTPLFLKKPTVVCGLDYFFWYGYLALLILISFLSDSYKSDYWLIMSTVIYGYAAAYLAFRVSYKRINFSTVRNAKGAIILLLLMLLWLSLQLVLPWQSSFGDYVLGQGYRPAWLQSTSLLSVVPERTKWLLLRDLMVFTLFLISLSLLDQRRRVKELIWVLLAVGCVHALLGIFAKYSGIYFVDKVSLDGHFDAARGWFVNRNHFAAFVSLCLISAISMQVKLLMVNRFEYWHDFFLNYILMVSLLAFVFGVGAIFLSESRGAFLALIASMLMCIGLLMRKGKFNIRRRYIIPCIIFVVIGLSVFLGEGMVERFSNNALNIGERQVQWGVTWQAIQSQFWFGYGAGSYELVFQSFREYADLRIVVYDQAHNDYLHVFLEQGFVGLLLWLGFIAYITKYVVSKYWKSKSTLVSSTLLSGVIVLTAILIQSLVDYPLQILSIRCYFFVIVALLLAAPHIKHKR